MNSKPAGKKTRHIYGELIKNDKKSFLYGCINNGYTFFMYVMTWSKKIIWFGSCFTLMYLFPFALESMNEQSKILAKITQSQMMDAMAGGDLGSSPVMRPF